MTTHRLIFYANLILINILPKTHCYNESSVAEFQKLLSTAKHILILTGPAIVPNLTFPEYRDDNFVWRKYLTADIATLDAFDRQPGRVWEFFHYLRWIALPYEPNQIHHTLAALQQRVLNENRQLTVITQCEDDLQQKAGIRNMIELNGCIYRTRCLRCGERQNNRQHPICEALRDHEFAGMHDYVSGRDLPHCTRPGCRSILGPDTTYFLSDLDKFTMKNLIKALDEADLYIVIGSPTNTSYARAYQPQFEDKGVPCIEFNPIESERSFTYTYSFIGPLNETIPKILDYEEITTTTEPTTMCHPPDIPVYDDNKPEWLEDMPEGDYA